jgi:hypothetical protein
LSDQHLASSSYSADEPSLTQEIDDIENATGVNPTVISSSSSSSRTIVCPWHKYDFDLRDGTSETGMAVCVYDVRIEHTGAGAGGDGEWVYVRAPKRDGREVGGREWEVVEFAGVSEVFAESLRAGESGRLGVGSGVTSTKPPIAAEKPTATATSSSSSSSSSIPPPTIPPNPTLPSLAIQILTTPSPTHKLDLTRQTTALLRSGSLRSIRPTASDVRAAEALFSDGREQGVFVPPRQGVEQVGVWGLKRRGKGGNEKSRVLMLREFVGPVA